jgi:hypothetical protein
LLRDVMDNIGHMRLEGYDPWPAIKGEVSV